MGPAHGVDSVLNPEKFKGSGGQSLRWHPLIKGSAHHGASVTKSHLTACSEGISFSSPGPKSLVHALLGVSRAPPSRWECSWTLNSVTTALLSAPGQCSPLADPPGSQMLRDCLRLVPHASVLEHTATELLGLSESDDALSLTIP